MDKQIRVMIADDHALVREGICAFLELTNDIKVVAEASDGLEAIQTAKRFRPDIILMDIAMPKLGGLETTIEIKNILPEIKILVLTQYEDKAYISRFLKTGVNGYLLKRAVGSELVDAIRAVSRGETYLHPSITSEVVAGYLGGDNKVAVSDPYDSLTDREKQVLKLIAEGCTHKEAAEMLNISVKTVIAHQSHISEKTGINNRAGLVKFAIQKGIIKLET